MARWRQVFDEETQTSEFVPMDSAAVARSSGGASIHGDITPFVSPVDGSVISDRKQLREHNKRNNVVNASEFSDEYYAKKRKERERVYTGERTKDQIRRDRMDINDAIEHHKLKGR